ncbi:MAG: CU044_5270 family protein, partial [Trebonia sp.]
MNDLDQLREFRAEIPYPERPRLSPGRSRLLSEARRPQRRRFSTARRSTLLLPAAAAAAAVAVAAGLAGYGLSTGSAPAPRPSAAAKHPAAPSQAVLAARMLNDASAAASRIPPKTTPNPGQWIYSKLVQYEYPQGTSSDENWITFDGTKSAYYASPGSLVTVHTSPTTPPADITSDPLAAFNTDATPQTAYYALASLPEAPGQLLAAVDKAAQSVGAANLAAGTPVAGHTPKIKGQLEFDYLSLLLWNAAGGVGAPPNAEAAAFRAMAVIPGVTVQRGITDAAWNPAIGVSGDGGYDQLLLDPVSYQVTGLRQFSTGVGPRPAAVSPQELAKFPKAEQQQILRKFKTQAGPPKRTVVLSMAYQ